MTGFDIAVLLLVGMGAIAGFLRGFVQEILSLASWIVALVAIRYLHTPLSLALESQVGTSSGSAVLALALLLLVPYVGVKLVAKRAGTFTRGSVLGPIDRVLGFGFGAVKGIIIVVLAFSVLALGYDTVWGPDGRPGWITQARAYSFIDASSRELVRMIDQRRRDMIEVDRKVAGAD